MNRFWVFQVAVSETVDDDSPAVRQQIPADSLSYTTKTLAVLSSKLTQNSDKAILVGRCSSSMQTLHVTSLKPF